MLGKSTKNIHWEKIPHSTNGAGRTGKPHVTKWN